MIPLISKCRKTLVSVPRRAGRWQDSLPPAGAVLSGLLMAAAFPPLEWSEAAWIALVPLALAVHRVSLRYAARLGWLAGLVFWLLSLRWIAHVTVMGWTALAMYCALYFIPFAVLVAWWGQRRGFTARVWNIVLMGAGVMVWTGAEYIRSTLLTGFPWNPLGVAQHAGISIIQLARLGGVYAVSALTVLVNLALGTTILRYAATRGNRQRSWHPELMLGLLLLALTHTYGWRTVRNDQVPVVPFRAALIQPNIPQGRKWTPAYIDTIYRRLSILTTAAAHVPGLDLVVWPETALPDDVRNSPPSYNLVMGLQQTNRVPLLVGSMDTEWTDRYGERYFNSSFLFDADGRIVQAYDKQHLVLMGEYVPFDDKLPFIEVLSPIEASFTPGTTGTVFRLDPPGITFSVLICFEDTLPRLSRQAFRNGARLLINQTNDGWFDVSSGSRQHMLHCIFRCVENGIPAVRAANTGISCFIDRFGRVGADRQYPVMTDGFMVRSINVPPAATPPTLYNRIGDLPATLCAAGCIALLAWIFFRHRH